MAKRVFLIHGWQGTPSEGWRPWLKKELEKRGFVVYAPLMPNADNPKMDEWVEHLQKVVGKPDKQCYFVGHSLGVIAILRYLEKLHASQKIGGSVFFAGFGQDLDYEGYKGELSNFFKIPIDWNKIKEHCKKFISIHSDNDPWVSLSNSHLFKEKLSANTIVMHNMKHFSGDDGIMELPIALECVLKLSNNN